MRLGKKNFFVQIKYSDLAGNPENMENFFLGFGGELYLSAEEIDSYDFGLIAGINSFTRKNNLPLRLHAPIIDIDYSRAHTTISRMQKLYGGVLKLCRALDMRFVVAHAEFGCDPGFPPEKQFKNAVSLWRVINAGLGAYDIGLNIENHCEIEPDYLIGLMREVASPRFGMCFDVGHSNAFGKPGIEAWLARYPAGSIAEVHLNDNAGDGDTHLPLGSGNIDFEAFFGALQARRENCVFVLEPRNITEARKSISFLKKKGIL